jgi:hypothetical protein
MIPTFCFKVSWLLLWLAFMNWCVSPGNLAGQVLFSTLDPSLAKFALTKPELVRAPKSGSGDYQVARINQLVEQIWLDYEIKPSNPASDGEWCRRLYLDLLGRIPSVAELQDFLQDKRTDKRKKLVEKLLYDDAYTEELARNWTTLWTNLLIGRTGGTENGSMISREGMQKYLRDSFARQKPYDQFVRELITATGKTTPNSDEFNGATNFLIDKVNQEQASQATAASSRLFLGLQVQCTQCHNHPFNDWKQQKYWEMNAFFRQVRAFRGASGPEMMNATAELRDQDFRGESEQNPDEAELYYELRNGLLSVAYPVFVDGQTISRSGYVKVVNRREKLADLMIESPYFAKALVNRMWAHFLGYGFTTPVDDLGPHNLPANPELLEYLAQEVRSSEYDLRQLMTWIALSRPYGLSSVRNKTNEKDDPLLGEAPKFSHFYLRQMEAEQLYESLLIATEVKPTGTYEERERTKNEWLQQFNRAFGNDEGLESTSFNGTIPQILMMFNGQMIRQAISTAEGSMLQQLARSSMKDRQKIERLFLAGLSRRPTSKEMAMATAFYQANGGDAANALAEIWWVILNSNEFIFNH